MSDLKVGVEFFDCKSFVLNNLDFLNDKIFG
jgi:hypothetical protein